MREFGSKLLLCLGTGGIAAIIDAGGFALLINTNLGIVLAGAASFCAAALVNYWLTSRFVFGREATLHGFALFLCTGVVGLTVNVGITLVGALFFAVPPLLAKLVGIGAAFLINFALNLRFVFGMRTIASTMQLGLRKRGISEDIPEVTPRSSK